MNTLLADESLSNIERVDYVYPELLAEEKDAYFMLAVDEYEQDQFNQSILRGNEELRTVINLTDSMAGFKLIRDVEVLCKKRGKNILKRASFNLN
ncbi:MAG: hypothetical protein LRY71_10515 [Bacillaceae bacterium]|nr:hypothetical protein [Bacillaceae bacterium]